MYKYLVVALLLSACGSEEPNTPQPDCTPQFEECFGTALLTFETRVPKISIWELGEMFAYCQEEYAACEGIAVEDIPPYELEVTSIGTKVTFRD